MKITVYFRFREADSRFREAVELLLIIALLTIIFCIPARGQESCPAGSRCVRQETIDKCAQIADELIAARDAIDKLKVAAASADVRDASAQRLIASYERLVSVGEKIQSEQDIAIALYKDAVAQLKDIVKMQFDIIAQLEKRLNAPKSAWAKFLDALKNAAILIGGIVVGSHL